MRSHLFTKFTLIALLATLGSEALAADAVPSLDLRGFDAPTGPDSGLYYESVTSPATFDFNAAWWQSYAYRPLTLRNAAGDVVHEVVSHQLSGDFTANVGLFERVSLGVALPMVLYQDGYEPTPVALRTLGAHQLPAQALGDLKLAVKGTLLPPTAGDLGGFGLAIHQRFGLPTGAESSFVAEGAVTSETRLLAEYSLLAISLHGAFGVKLRSEEEAFGCGGPGAANGAPSPAGECATTFGHQLPWGLSVNVMPKAFGIDEAGRWNVFLEAFGYLPLAPEAPFSSAALSQTQLAAGASVDLGADISLLAALDAALVGGIGTPPVRGTLAIRWAPRKHDMDDDGVRDEDDLCPEDLQEDHDGFEDHDGCPEWDNDDDMVPDGSDRCPDEREDQDGYQDDDGCVDPDNDSDGILDIDDACPDVVGIASSDPKLRGCPDPDPDKDGVKGEADQCPLDAEDADGFKDEDGCPDPDNDGDGVLDAVDGCPDKEGPARTDEHSGCPDGDGDGIVDTKDACPEEKPGDEADAERPGCPKGSTKSGDKKPGDKKPGDKKPGEKVGG